MQLSEIAFRDASPVEGYGPGFFRIGGRAVEGALCVSPNGRRAWGGLEDAATLLDMAADIDVLFVGTGAEIAHLPASLREKIEAAGIGVEVMNSPAACRTYNVLLSEGRRVALAALPV
ncbi:Mth938-like domain-containing protein [Litorisediminicola beolgyonensis]|uniref:Mth938-like domain-containing protein n=1 Tax=Litorisediminicola beolgyonensis TaxID=1173614 RepID=A0ABW3ZH23_9RHOB